VALLVHWVTHMEKEQIVSIQQMKDALAKNVGSKFPVKVTTCNGEVMVRYIRGFADTLSNIVLISENSYSLALRILEVKEIEKLEFAPENSDGEWKTMVAKSSKNRAKI
jgi:hypothetical protein